MITYDYMDGSSIPHVVVILGEYQYKAAFVGDQEINMLACLTEIMARGKLNERNTETQYDIQLPAGTAVQFKGVELGMEKFHIAYLFDKLRKDFGFLECKKTNRHSGDGEVRRCIPILAMNI